MSWEIDTREFPNRVYSGVKSTGRDPPRVFTRDLPCGQEEELRIKPSLSLFNHNPNGFDWGNEDSGALQLSLALLLDTTHNPEYAIRYHQQFAQFFVLQCGFFWRVTKWQILDWMAVKLAESNVEELLEGMRHSRN